MSEMSDMYKLIMAMRLAKRERVGLGLTYFDVIELLGELDSLKSCINELEEIDRMRSESVSTLNQANANNEDEIELLEKRIAELEGLAQQLIWVGNDLLTDNTSPVTITLFSGLAFRSKELLP